MSQFLITSSVSAGRHRNAVLAWYVSISVLHLNNLDGMIHYLKDGEDALLYVETVLYFNNL